MARIQTFRRDLQLATAGLSPAAIAPALAAFAKSELANAISSGEGSPIYDKYVNGNLDADESSVIPPGPILYVFSWWNEIVQFALDSLIARSPVKSGDYKTAWQVMVGGAIVSDFKNIPVSVDVLLVNPLPYARKIDVGHMQMSVPPFVVEDVRSKVMGVYGNIVTAKRTMVTLPGGYVLKGYFRRGIRPHARTKLQKDTRAGATMTYPALVLSMRGD